MSDPMAFLAVALGVIWAGLWMAREIAGRRRQDRQDAQIRAEYDELLRRFEERKRREWRGD